MQNNQLQESESDQTASYELNEDTHHTVTICDENGRVKRVNVKPVDLPKPQAAPNE